MFSTVTTLYFYLQFSGITQQGRVMKGPGIRFIAGKYARKAGWINTDEDPDEDSL